MDPLKMFVIDVFCAFYMVYPYLNGCGPIEQASVSVYL